MEFELGKSNSQTEAEPLVPATQPDDDFTPEEQFAKGMEKQNAGDYPAALELFEKAAQRGHAEAQYTCCWKYHWGEGTEEDKSPDVA